MKAGVLLHGAVDLWIAHASALDDEDARQHCRDLVVSHERESERLFHRESDQRLYLLARALSRSALSQYYPVRPQDWRFVRTKYGRPAVAPEHGVETLSFNISHSADFVVCAVAAGAIGVDTECWTRSAPLEIADHCFSSTELRHLRQVPPAKQSSLFFEYWTLKESFIKARGEGLSIPMDQVEFDLSTNEKCAVRLHEGLGQNSERWSFALLNFAEKNLVAICSERSATDARGTRIRQFLRYNGARELRAQILRLSYDESLAPSFGVPEWT